MAENSLPGIPRELRLQIFRYLLPDINPVPYRSHMDRCPERINVVGQPGRPMDQPEHCAYIPLRKDRESCCTQILRVSRQFYEEGNHILYHNKTFEVRLLSLLYEGVQKLPGYTFWEDVIESIKSKRVSRQHLLHMKSLYINIETSTTLYFYWKHDMNRLEDRVHQLVEALRKAKTVTSLDIAIESDCIILEEDWLLDPFDMLRDMSEVKIRYYKRGMCAPCPTWGQV